MYNKHNPKISPLGIALINKWQIKLGDAGTIDHFGLALQYQIKTLYKKGNIIHKISPVSFMCSINGIRTRVSVTVSYHLQSDGVFFLGIDGMNTNELHSVLMYGIFSHSQHNHATSEQHAHTHSTAMPSC